MNKKYDEGYWNMVRISNDDKEYPTKMGEKWTDAEETKLLKELNENIDIEEIAIKHERTIGGIYARCRDIAYKMYLKNIPFDEITKQTKLDYNNIMLTIEKKQKTKNRDRDKDKDKKITSPIDNVFITINKSDYTQLQSDVKNIKNDIKDIKYTMGELVEMMKALYEFEKS